MRRNINRVSKYHIDNFMCADTDCKSCTGQAGSMTFSLFAHSDDMKIMIGWLQAKGLDVFKRGTKEPERIRLALVGAKWFEIMLSAPATNVHTFADNF